MVRGSGRAQKEGQTLLLPRSAASLANEVDNDTPCERCGDASFHDTGPRAMVLCDHCDSGYHLGCLRPPRKRRPTGLWWCPECLEKLAGPRAASPADDPVELEGTQRLGRDHTFEFAQEPRFDKTQLRAEALLHEVGPFPTEQDLRRVLGYRWATGTSKAYKAAYGRFCKFCADGNYELRAVHSLALYGVARIAQGVSAETIRRDFVAIRQSQEAWEGDPSELVKLQKAATRLAPVPSQAKAPLTPDLMERLRRTIFAWETHGPRIRSLWLRVRDWTFYLLGTLGFFRGREVAALEWRHLRFQGPPGARTSVTVRVVQSKTDPAGEGRDVPVSALADGPPYHCPVRSLEKLQLAASGDGPVFTTVYQGKESVQTRTMLKRLHRYLAKILPDSSAVKRFGLHSMRKGGATTALQVGVPVEQIKLQGRWKSDAVFRYLKVTDAQAKSTSLRVAQAFARK